VLGRFLNPKLHRLIRFPPAARGFLSTTEISFLFVLCLLIGCALFLPPIAQDQNYHGFADQRPWGVVPNAADTFSNSSFLVAGLWGLWRLAGYRGHASNPLILRLVSLLLIGVLLTGLASMFYHLAPNDSRLAIDRLAMSLSFAAALGLLVADRVSVRFAVGVVAGFLFLGPLTVWVWSASGNLTPYAVLQFGGVAMIAVFCWRPSLHIRGLNFSGLLLFYGLAKLAELLDSRIFELSLALVSGHTLKHVFAAIGIVVLVLPLLSRPRPQAESVNT
jgi:hypothetical protein